MRLEFSAFVEGDLDRIAATIAHDTPRRAVAFIRDLRMAIKTFARDPVIYQLRPDIGDAARLASVGRYAILFRLNDDVMRIERVVWAGRNLAGIIIP